jgi:hypothetical protein
VYYLDYPNYEVESSFIGYLLEAFSGLDIGESGLFAKKLYDAFSTSNIALIVSILQTVFKKIPYQLHEKNKEGFYHAAVHLLFTYLGIRIESEVCLSDGRSDAVVHTKTHTFIFEFKLDESPEIALQQIIDKDYTQAFRHNNKEIIGIGINFTTKKRNIDGWASQVL